jgi:LacI family transcriptional regulator
MIKTKTRITVKDIAAQAGVSVSTVHLVLAEKLGPKEETRRRVLEVAEELNYQYNSVAASLKRGVTRFAVILPALTDDNLLYYTPIWRGVRAYCENARDFNVELIEIPYINKDLVAVPTQALMRVVDEEKISGLIVLGDIEPDARCALRTLSSQGIPVVLVHSDAPDVGRICCVQAENYLLGCTMGEILYRQTPRGSSILICAGDRNAPANVESVQGVEDYFSAHGPARTVHKIHYGNDMSYLYRQLMERFEQFGDIAGCCSVTARGSVQLAKALSDAGKAGLIPAIGSDVFEENIESLKNGTFINLMFKNPFQQGWLAAEKLFNCLIRNQLPDTDMFLVKSEVVFQSSVSMYEHARAEEGYTV